MLFLPARLLLWVHYSLGRDPLAGLTRQRHVHQGLLWKNDLEMGVSNDHRAEVELWGVPLCGWQLPHSVHSHARGCAYAHTYTPKRMHKTHIHARWERRMELWPRERTMIKWKENRHRDRMNRDEEQVWRKRKTVTECVWMNLCAHEWEKSAPHPTWPSPGTVVRDIMSIPECRLHCCIWLTQTPLPFLLCFWLSNSFCFVFTNNKRDARVSSRQETSFLPLPPSTPPEWADHTNGAAPTG